MLKRKEQCWRKRKKEEELKVSVRVRVLYDVHRTELFFFIYYNPKTPGGGFFAMQPAGPIGQWKPHGC